MKEHNYILLKVKGSWIEREQTKGLISMHFPDSVEVVSDGIVPIQSTIKVDKEHIYYYKNTNLMEETKKRIASALGQYLLEQGYIRINEEAGQWDVEVKGTVLVIQDTPTEKEGVG